MSIANYPFWRVVPSDNGREGAYTLPVMPPATVGPEGAPHIMGGVALAAAVDAMELASGQPILWAHVQFLSPTQHAEELTIHCEQCGGGQSVGQWMAEANVNGRPTHRVSAALGAREPSEKLTFVQMPDLPGPDDCEPTDETRWSADGSLIDQFEMRLAKQDSDIGFNAVWVRNAAGFANDSGWLAIISDFFLGAHPKSANGFSLDATFRLIQSAPPGWVLSVTQMGAISRGVIHGQTQHFSENGQLLALSSQTGVLPRITRS
ncbi:thioesterase family protein [uncultured Erythrobacter sp.]|uniref:thioesterase family protein n=1 Tax=uncultured Erythrobacter sp. TaxID=263913 RepID=UPI0026338EA3|nr:thioesterase family protein [uncultured Erythrobacter sp.]